MRIDLSPVLAADQPKLIRTPASKLTVERWMPEWVPAINDAIPVAGQHHYCHAACTLAGGSILFRARFGTIDDPTLDSLYYQWITGDDIAHPENWEWIEYDYGIGITGPWVANDPLNYNGSSMVAVPIDDESVRLFVFWANTLELDCLDFDADGDAGSGTVTSLDEDSLSYSSLLIASSRPDEVFISRLQLVEYALCNWRKDSYGSTLVRYVFNGVAWEQQGSDFHFHTHAENCLLRDGQFAYGEALGGGVIVPIGGEITLPDPEADTEPWGTMASVNTIEQWGTRFTGGMCAHELSGDRVLITGGWVYWRRWGYETHSQGLIGYVYHRDSELWERTFLTGHMDFSDGEKLHADVFVSGSTVNGKHFIIWNRNAEPSEDMQVHGSLDLPRQLETVYCSVDDTGLNTSQWAYLGPQSGLTGAHLVEVIDPETDLQILYALGWNNVYRSEAAAYISRDNNPLDLELVANQWKTTFDNDGNASIDVPLETSAELFVPGTKLVNGSLLRVFCGLPGDLVQVAQGWIDITKSTVAVGSRNYTAKLNARPDKLLLDTKSESVEDILPQDTVYIEPDTDQLVGLEEYKGYWDVATGRWDTPFFGDAYGMSAKRLYRLMSFPYAWTGGGKEGTLGNPGKILTQRERHMGTWFKDLAWLVQDADIDGMIQATVRMGAPYSLGNEYTFENPDSLPFLINKCRPSIDANGMLTEVDWDRYDGFEEDWVTSINTPQQWATMAGLVAHTEDVGKKYIFAWEAGSDFSESSHVDDTWKAESFDKAQFTVGAPAGSNRLHLYVSDYNDTSENWEADRAWINTSVCAIPVNGVTPGQPMDMKIVSSGGTLYCFYRPYAPRDNEQVQWTFAFKYKTGRFGAGKFGFVGRGHAGVQWDAYFPGASIVQQFDNYVDFWNISYSNCDIDYSMEEVLRKYAYRGYVDAAFRDPVVDEPLLVVDGYHHFRKKCANVTATFYVTIPMGVEAGLYVKCPSSVAGKLHYKIGLVAGQEFPENNQGATSYMVKRKFSNSVSQYPLSTEYYPSPVLINQDCRIPVRVSARGDIYTIWVAGNYVGHFVGDETELETYFGLYTIGGAATFEDLYVSELYEVLEYSTLDLNQTYADAISKVLDKRRIKRVWQPDGKLMFSYYANKDTGPTFEENIVQSDLSKTDRFFSRVKVEGAYTSATYASERLLPRGERYQTVHLPNIYAAEFCYREAKAYIRQYEEKLVTASLSGLPDLRVQPEDAVQTVVSQQNLDAGFIVDSVDISYKLADKPVFETKLGIRQSTVPVDAAEPDPMLDFSKPDNSMYLPLF